MEGLISCDKAKELDCLIGTIQTKQDCETIFQLVPFLNAYPELSFGMIPYISLFAVSTLEFLNEYGNHCKNIDFQTRNRKGLADLRAKLKVFDSGFVKTRRMVLNIDFIQDQIFIKGDKLYMPFEQASYPNLGFYTDNENRIIGNTHYAYYVMQDDRIISRNAEEMKEAYLATPSSYSFSKVSEEGYIILQYCGSIVSSIEHAMEELTLPTNPEVCEFDLEVNCAFANTNDRVSLVKNAEIDKAAFLYILHILTTINYMLFIINKCEKTDTGWWLRVNYIAYYYCVSRLRSIQTYFRQSKIKSSSFGSLFSELNLEHENMINTDFRSCLMHARYYHEDRFMIKPEYIDTCKPLFGLVETQFNGMSYITLKGIIQDRMLSISSILAKWLDFTLPTRPSIGENKRQRITVSDLREMLNKSE